MITCRIEPWLRDQFPSDVAVSLREHFDVVRAVEAVSFPGVPGLEHLGVVAFGAHLNIVSGRLHKTRFLQQLKLAAGPASDLPQLSLAKLGSLSAGQWMMLVFENLIRVQPVGTCLLCDDILDHVDLPHIRAAFALLRAHPRQVVVTVRPRMMPMVQNLVRDAEVVFVDLDAII